MLKAKIISCLALFLLLKEATSLNCTSNTDNEDYEPFPKNVTPAQFHTRMEITLSDRNETVFVDEKYDAVNQRGYVTILVRNSSWEVYYDRPENEIDHVIDEDCWSYNWTETRLERFKCLYLQNESSLGLIRDVCSATVVLDLAYKNKTAGARFLGRKVVRNIPVKGWRICQSNTSLDFWFTVRGWYHSTGDFPIPALVEARPDNASQLIGGLIHSYTFLDFFPDEPGFKVPKVFWCQGAFDPPPLPTLPRRFDVNLESVNAESSRTRGVREYYDLEKQLLRIDFDARGRRPPLFGTGPSIDIRDKKTGKGTRHNRKTGRCEEFQLGKPQFRASKYHYRIDVPFGRLALFEDSAAKPTYRGRAKTRQIACDVWQQKRVNWPGNFTGEMVWRWYFSRRNRIRNRRAKPVPVKLEIEGQIHLNAPLEEEFEFNYNFYAFESERPTPNAFDVSAICATKPSSSKQEKRLSSGAVAGISVVCVVVGLLLGTAIVFVLAKKNWLPRKGGPPPVRFS